MARKHTHQQPGSGAQEHETATRPLTKEAFGARVQQRMFEKGWSQSELARRADLRRDAISTYITGRAFPSPTNLHKLAKALDTDPDALRPSYVAPAVSVAPAISPSIHLNVSTERPSEAWLRVDCRLSLKTALEVMRLIEADRIPA